jgi:membrane protein YdbS with pleckstrin-like domain
MTEPVSVADGVERHVDERIVPVDRIGGWLFAAVVSLVALVMVVLPALVRGRVVILGLVLAGWFALTAALGWAAHYWPPIAWRHTWFRVDDDGLEIRRGVAWRHVITVPRSRVQHTDVSQGPLERRYGLATLVVYTAGAEHAKVTLPGLEHGAALAIRQHLLPVGDGNAV